MEKGLALIQIQHINLSNLAYLCSLALAVSACSTTSQERYEQLKNKNASECAANLTTASRMPAIGLSIGRTVDGEFSADHCVDISKSIRVSYQIFEFTPTSASHSVEVISFITPRGLGFGGENTITIPMVNFYLNDSPVRLLPERKMEWIKTLVDGSMLKNVFRVEGLIPQKRYRLVLTADTQFLGKEFPGYSSTAAAGIVVVGPFGKTKITLN